MLHLTFFQLSLHMLHICLFGLGVCPYAHLYPCLCLHKILCFGLCVCVGVLFLYLSLCPSLYCNMFSFPPHCSASLPGQGVWSKTSQEVFVTHWTEGESKQWDAQTQEVLLSSCRLQPGVFHSALHDQKEETWGTSLPANVFLRVLVSSISFSGGVSLSYQWQPPWLCAAALSAWILVISFCVPYCSYISW